MAEEIRKARNIRRSKLGCFTRKKNHIIKLLDGEARGEKLKTEYDELVAAFKLLEVAQEDVLVLLEEADLEAEETFLDDSAQALSEVDVRISTAASTEAQQKLQEELQKKADNEAENKKKEYDSALAIFKTSVESFGKPSANLSQLSAENKISTADMRLEITKLEEIHARIIQEKAKVVSIDPSADHSGETAQFDALVSAELDRCKRIAMEFLKDVPEASVSVVGTPSERPCSGSGTGFSFTKRETVMLPKFSGEEKTAYLQYPVWKQQWTNNISEYEEKYRATMLLNHLDAKALDQIVGLENEYDKAMFQLDNYYNDAKKIVKACLDEIRAHSNINSFDYKALVSYKKCLVNNFTRLKAGNLEHEMSNSAALSVLVRKLPIQEAVDWQKFLAKKDKTEQAKPFPFFIEWLQEAGASWELLAASGTGAKGKPGSSQVHQSFFTDGEDLDSTKQSKPCYRCGDTGHWKRDCPKSGSKSAGKVTGGGKGADVRIQRDRGQPKHRKFHCAFHKGTPGKNCSTWSCAAVKYTPFDERIKLMKANGDCDQCCGDCPKGNCLSKVKRTCGGGKDGRGCGANHLGHELWCQAAKLCFKTRVETVLNAGEEAEDGVLLQLMKIPSIDENKAYETVLWDSACSSIFVRHGHAKDMNFPYKEKRLRVEMLGGIVKEIDGIIYECQVKDQSGRIHKFMAHGLDEVTGSIGKPIGKNIMKKMFPDVLGAHTMTGATQVDYMIGLSKAS